MAQYSAGTYTYKVFNNVTGTTANCEGCTTTAQPHPIYSSITNTADTVVQLMAVTIGGFNGLNN
jgi:hypothetical protein